MQQTYQDIELTKTYPRVGDVKVGGRIVCVYWEASRRRLLIPDLSGEAGSCWGFSQNERTEQNYWNPEWGDFNQLCGIFDRVVGEEEEEEEDSINHPTHYTSHPSGIECIEISEHMGFCLGNALKYIWRADLKGKAVEDLKKARWYIDREIQKRNAE